MTNNTIHYPLTKKAICANFESVTPADVTLVKGQQRGWHEACLDVDWSLAAIRKKLRGMGFSPVKGSEDTLWVNSDNTVGVQCMGNKPHPTKNRWISFSLEIQARKSIKVIPEIRIV